MLEWIADNKTLVMVAVAVVAFVTNGKPILRWLADKLPSDGESKPAPAPVPPAAGKFNPASSDATPPAELVEYVKRMRESLPGADAQFVLERLASGESVSAARGKLLSKLAADRGEDVPAE
jgi:hypothetical protein